MKKHEYLLLLFVIAALVFYYNKPIIDNNTPTDTKPKVIEPIAPVVVPDIKPDENKNGCNIVLEKALQNNKNLLIIFSAKWCGYCRSLKADLEKLDVTNYEICYIDIDEEPNKDLVKHFNIKMVPTSISVDPKNNKEVKRISGYIPDKYQKWLSE
jgi:thioredoxin-related protein